MNEGHFPHYHQESGERCSQYALRRRFQLGRMLGWGTQGIVFETPQGSVVKGLLREPEFIRERNVYMRLRAHDATELCGFSIPKLIDFDNELLVIEMGFVSAPCVIDFASAELDSKTEFPDEMIGPWQEKEAEAFGDRISEARRIAYSFEKFGIFLSDLNPGNIRFAED